MQINISIKFKNKLKILKGIVTWNSQIYSTKKYCTRDFRNGCFDIWYSLSYNECLFF
jgi:hypothetical protein